MFVVEDVADGDESLSVQPWKGAIKTPANPPQIISKDPEQKYEIDFVFGVETTDSLKHLGFNSKGQIVYMTASLGVVLDWSAKGKMTQKIFGGFEVQKKVRGKSKIDVEQHTDDIISLKLSLDR